MNITVWTVTLNDDYAMPYCKVFATEVDAIGFVLDYLEIDDYEERGKATQAYHDGELTDWINEHDYTHKDGDSYVIQSHEIPNPIDQVKAKLAELRPHFHAISLHADCLDQLEHQNHGWELACAIDKLDLELGAPRTDEWLKEESKQ